MEVGRLLGHDLEPVTAERLDRVGEALAAIGRDRDAGDALDLDDVALAAQLVGDERRRLDADLVVVAEDRGPGGVRAAEEPVDVDDRDAGLHGLLGDRGELGTVVREHDERVGVLVDDRLDLRRLAVGVGRLQEAEVDIGNVSAAAWAFAAICPSQPWSVGGTLATMVIFSPEADAPVVAAPLAAVVAASPPVVAAAAEVVSLALLLPLLHAGGDEQQDGDESDEVSVLLHVVLPFSGLMSRGAERRRWSAQGRAASDWRRRRQMRSGRWIRTAARMITPLTICCHSVARFELGEEVEDQPEHDARP